MDNDLLLALIGLLVFLPTISVALYLVREIMRGDQDSHVEGSYFEFKSRITKNSKFKDSV